MKKLLLILIAILGFNLSNAQTHTKFTELNTGISVGTVPMFPGVSFLFGEQVKFDSGVILEYEGGIAFPSIFTGKAGIGFSLDKKFDLTAGIRPWPTSTYLQIQSHRPDKLRDILFTVERMSWGSTSFGQSFMFTVGWKYNIIK